ncbi:MAG TPA: TolC family protein [Thermoanaerobaculia bacterium]|jgi:outer membrane protein TolC|nr:TolC family protein [Thermoanaerobaculia bacterium]
MKRLAALLLFATSAIAGETLTLDQAVSIAIDQNANVRNAQLEVEKGQTRIDATRTKRLPSMTFAIVGGEALNNISIEVDGRDERIDLGRTFSMYGIARISQPITQQHAIGLGVRLNEASLAIDKENERAARLAITREVKSAYFAVLSARGYADALREAVTAWEEVDREMNVRVAAKTALEADRLDAAARLASTRVAALSAANSLATAKDRLNYLVGKEVDVEMASATMADASGLEARSPEQSNRPDVKEAELRLEQAKLDLRLKHADRIPEVALTISSAMPFNNDNLPRNMTSAGITMSYEPFTWGRRKAEMSEKRHAVEQAENALRDKQSAAAVEIAVRGRKVEEAAAQIAVRRLEVEAARERLRVTKTKFQQQAVRPDEMFNASASLTQAAAREQEAISAYWTARADYEQATGEES